MMNDTVSVIYLHIYRDGIITDYFLRGFTNREVCYMLESQHNVIMSTRTLKRKLKDLGLRRCSSHIDHQRVVQAVQYELGGSGCCLGYRSMTVRLRNVHGIRVPRDMVMHVMRALDPDGNADRRLHRFSRRSYYNMGPNYLLHIDGYDKLKPFGFAIHGAIDGFSRRIIWLKTGRTNNNPYIVAHHFMQYIEDIGGAPRCVRGDRGNENVFIEDLQKAMRWTDVDDMAAENSFIYGSSHRNQRIERWWLTLRQSGGNFWINFFKDMESQGIVSLDNPLHIEILRYSFNDILQYELDMIAREWNQHRVTSKTGPSGKPDVLYFAPSIHGAVDYKIELDTDDIASLKSMCETPSPSGCDADFANVCNTLLENNGKSKPSDAKEAMAIFAWIADFLE